MSYYMIDAARFDAKESITHVRLGKVDNARNKWVYEPEISEVSDVVNTMHNPANIVMVRTAQGSQGATVRIAVEAATGREFIVEVEPENHPGGTLKDLPTC